MLTLNKSKIFLILILASAIVFAADNTRRKKTQQRTTQQTTNRKETTTWKDPKIPSLNKSSIDFQLNKFRSMIIDNKWPATVQACLESDRAKKKKNRRITNIESDIFLNKLRETVINPDLEEVSGYRKSWFVSVGKLVAQFDAIVQAATTAIDKRNNAAYQRTISYIPALAKQLDTLLKNPVKIPEKELKLIQAANEKRRTAENNKNQQGGR